MTTAPPLLLCILLIFAGASANADDPDATLPAKIHRLAKAVDELYELVASNETVDVKKYVNLSNEFANLSFAAVQAIQQVKKINVIIHENDTNVAFPEMNLKNVTFVFGNLAAVIGTTLLERFNGKRAGFTSQNSTSGVDDDPETNNNTATAIDLKDPALNAMRGAINELRLKLKNNFGALDTILSRQWAEPIHAKNSNNHYGIKNDRSPMTDLTALYVKAITVPNSGNSDDFMQNCEQHNFLNKTQFKATYMCANSTVVANYTERHLEERSSENGYYQISSADLCMPTVLAEFADTNATVLDIYKRTIYARILHYELIKSICTVLIDPTAQNIVDEDSETYVEIMHFIDAFFNKQLNRIVTTPTLEELKTNISTTNASMATAASVQK